MGEANTFDETAKHCNCLTDFEFYYNSPEGGACYRSCESISNTNGDYFGSTPNSCACTEGFKWSDIAAQCEIQCNGLYDNGAASETTCTCKGAAVFVSSLNKCLPICKSDSLSTGNFSYDSFGC